MGRRFARLCVAASDLCSPSPCCLCCLPSAPPFPRLQAGLIISGINAEVMPGQWEFQIGPTGPLETGDQVRGAGAVDAMMCCAASAGWLAGCRLCPLPSPAPHPTLTAPPPTRCRRCLQVMIARWLLHRLGEEFGIISTFAPKPMKGDW